MRTTTITLMLAVAAVTLSSCGGWAREGEPQEEELVLRGYAAPGQAEDLADAIGRMLVLGERRVGSARVGPGDQLLVLAPRSVQENIAELIRAARDTHAAADPASIAMTYWFVAARPGAEPAPVGPGLKEIESALDEIAGVQGPLEFRLIERLRLRQAPGIQTARGRSYNTVVGQRVSISNGLVLATVDAQAGHFQIETNVGLRPDQLLVLGEVALDPRNDPFPPSREPLGGDAAAPAPPAETALYLIIRADVDSPS